MTGDRATPGSGRTAGPERGDELRTRDPAATTGVAGDVLLRPSSSRGMPAAHAAWRPRGRPTPG